MDSKTKDTQIIVRLTDDMYNEIKATAEEDDISMAELLRRGARLYINNFQMRKGEPNYEINRMIRKAVAEQMAQGPIMYDPKIHKIEEDYLGRKWIFRRDQPAKDLTEEE